MEPVCFGKEKGVLGWFHPGAPNLQSGAVLICPPLFSDYFRTYQVLKKSALALSAIGFDVLRFDYRGTGDSALDLEATSPGDWIADISSGAAELLDLSGKRSFTLISVRLSSLLASKAESIHPKMERMICWDPIVSGSEYIDQLQRLQKNQNGSRKLKTPILPGEVGGYLMGEDAIAELREIEGIKDQGNIQTIKSESVMEVDCEWESMTHSVMFAAEIVNALVEGVTNRERHLQPG